MKKELKIFIIILVIIIVLGIGIFFIYSNRKGYETEDYNQEETQVNEFNEYSVENSIKNGYVIVGNKVFNKSKLDDFIENTKSDSKNRMSDAITIIQYTSDNYPIIINLEYKLDVGYTLKIDNTMVEPKSDVDFITIDDLPSNLYTIKMEESEGIVRLILKLTKEIEDDEYKSVPVVGYLTDKEVYDTTPTFEGEVTEINNEKILLKVDEKGLPDYISIKLVNEDKFAIGDKVEVNYTEIISSSDPCEANHIDIKKIEK